MIIRKETPSDKPAVFAVNAAAFETDAEAKLVDMLRDAAEPYISLVMDQNDIIIGHIMFTPVTLDGFDGLIMGLAPMAVMPSHQKKGTGSYLVNAGLKMCKDMGAVACVVLGHPDYYPKFGFKPANSTFGIKSTYDVPDEVFMAQELVPDALEGASGTVEFHPAFNGL